jgi:predicted metal-dependent hydrolase
MNTYSALISGKEISYTLKISARRRTVGLRIDERGLTVHIPKRIPQRSVESLLQDKSDWITRKLAEFQDRPAAIQWQDGAALRYLGQDIQLSLRQDARNRAVEFDGARLYLALPNPDDDATVQRKVAQWYRKQALNDFARRIELLSAKLGVPTPPMFLSNARTRWGSCNSRGEIRLHWRLIQAPPHIIHYVISHELAHLKEMNHSPEFWAWVGKLCPDYSATRHDLKVLSAQLHLV